MSRRTNQDFSGYFMMFAAVVGLSACGNLPASIQKVGDRDRERAALEQKETEKREAEANEREKAANAAKEKAAEEEKADIPGDGIPVELIAELKMDKTLLVGELEENGVTTIGFTDAQKKALLGKEEKIPLAIDEIPDTTRAIVHVFVEKESDQESIAAAELDLSILAEKGEKTAYFLKLGNGKDQSDALKKLLRGADWIIEMKEATPEIETSTSSEIEFRFDPVPPPTPAI